MRIGTMMMIALLAACGGAKPANTTTTTSSTGGSGNRLFTSLGGEDALKMIVKDFVEQEVEKDSRISMFFTNTDIPAFEQKLYRQLCEASGGNCVYTGKDMKAAHVNMHIKQADFDALIEDLVKTLDKLQVKDADKKALLDMLGPMKTDIVTAQ